MATLKEAIEKVGVGGRVKNNGHHYEHVVTAVGEKLALLKYTGNLNSCEDIYYLIQDGWSPVLPKKRVVFEAYQKEDGMLAYFEKDKSVITRNFHRYDDIPDMIFEDGKQVFE